MTRRSLASLAVLALLIAGCSDDSGTASDPTDSTPTDATAPPADGTGGTGESPGGPAEGPEPEIWTGSDDDFYVVPDPLPAGEAGDLIRLQDLGSDGSGHITARVMYLSNDASGTDRAVTGLVTYPEGDAPAGGWPVISTAHGTTGVAGHCAPSRSAGAAPGWGVDGVWAMTDYVGMGPVGEMHPYLSKPSEGNAVIDAVRAARQIPEAGAGTRWVSIGHSQGGHGSLSAHELAAERAPELELLGTVALSPGAMMDRVYGGIDPIVTTILTMMATWSSVSERPEIDPADYFTDEAIAASEVFETGCLQEITDALIPIAVEGPFTADPRETEPAAGLVRENDVGHVAVAGVPVYMASGTVDDRVVIDRVRDLFDRMCEAGQVTDLTVIEGADHGSILGDVADEVTAFIEARLAGDEPVDACP